MATPTEDRSSSAARPRHRGPEAPPGLVKRAPKGTRKTTPTNAVGPPTSRAPRKARKLDQHGKDKPTSGISRARMPKEKQQTGGGGSKATSASSITRWRLTGNTAPRSGRGADGKATGDQEVRDNFITVELVEDNLADWNVKLHQVDKDSALRRRT
ncbi:ubiquitin-conjugating enzyme E2Q-like protein 1 [Lates japonicus]|uniref:Ubiquitin-conjugating enzyme E2Q-like protein 1 n=1 Tax=Lates japonicus TaxID=270547 RepID=A0AAD3NC51_LATJO|nr:ubiquitin-conjugating enzyme E2Q-like protein 1 [Lates japonicus]